MNAPTRRHILSAVAAMPSLALPAAAAGNDSPVRAAIEAFDRIKAERDVALESVKTLRVDLAVAYDELANLGIAYDNAARRVYETEATTPRDIEAKILPREFARAASTSRITARVPTCAPRGPQEI